MAPCGAPCKELAQQCWAPQLGVELQRCSMLPLQFPSLLAAGAQTQAAGEQMQQRLCQSPPGLPHRGVQVDVAGHRAKGHQVGLVTHEVLGQPMTSACCQCTRGRASNTGIFHPLARIATMQLAGLSRDLGTLSCWFSPWQNLSIEESAGFAGSCLVEQTLTARTSIGMSALSSVWVGGQ